MRLRRSPRVPPPIDEASAYARCHGERGGEILRVAPLPPPPPPPLETTAPERTLTGETLRLAFEARLRARAAPPT